MRTLASGAATQFGSAIAGPVVLFVFMDLTSPLYLNSSPNTIAWDGHDWLGAGSLGAVEEIDDRTAEQKSLRFTLSGVPSTMLAIALAEPVRNKACVVSVCVLDATSHAVLDVPAVWTGTLDQMAVTQTSSGCTVSVTAEHPGATYGRAKPLRYTDADQQTLYPGDTCLRFIVDQSQKQDIWPAASFFRQ